MISFQHLKVFFVSLLAYLAIDAIWIGLVAKHFYATELLPFQRTLRLAAVGVVYPLIVLGIFLFVLPKTQQRPVLGLLWGALFGFIGYGIYDLTNLAILAHWSLRMTVVDMLWGATICGLTGMFMVLVAK